MCPRKRVFLWNNAMAEMISANVEKDIADIGKSINEKTVINPRYGNPFDSLPLAIQKVMEAGGFQPFLTETALLASVPTVSPKAAKALDTKKIWYWGGSSWVDTGLSELDQAKVYTDGFDSLKLNKGKVYPFKSISRNGITSSASADWNNLILDVRVENAEPGKYYQIAYQQNGALVNGKNEYNWIIYEFDAATYNTAAVATAVVNYTDAGQQQLVKNGTIQTVNIKSLTKPKLLFKITCDTSALPAGTSPINSTAQGNNSWSHIIDPQRYETNETLINIENAPRSWLYNKGSYYPFVQSAFNGATSVAHSTFLNAIKDFEVINAADGYFYSLAYYTNGNTATGADRQERWIIHKRPRTGYTAAGATQEQIVALTIPQETLIKSGGIEKIRLVSAGNEYFDITVDTSKLPAYGTFISSANTGDGGYSWYMSPTNYRKKVTSEANVIGFNAFINYVASTKTFKYRYRSKGKLYEIVFGPNGANSLPNFKSIGSSTGNDLTGAFSDIQAFSTDWLPPLVFYAVNNADDSNISSFTGGNHASNGDATGDPTAANELYTIFVDGNVLDMSQDFSGACNNIEVKIVNKIMASNTKTTSKRYCLKQIFDLNFNGSNVDVHCKLRALEDIKLRSDYGPQLTTSGFNTTQLMLEASATTRAAYDNNATSGVRSSFPKAFALILKGTGGILASWIDRSYGNGTPQNCAPDQPLIRGGTSTNHKFYHCAFRSMLSDEVAFPPLLLTVANSDYKWRGGYVIQSDNTDGIYDSILKLDQKFSIVNGVNYY